MRTVSFRHHYLTCFSFFYTHAKTQRDSRAYRLNPWPQVGGTLIEAGVLDKVFLAFVAHDSTVIPVEVVQVRVIFMGLLCGVGRATGVGTPWLTLETEAERHRQ